MSEVISEPSAADEDLNSSRYVGLVINLTGLVRSQCVVACIIKMEIGYR